MKEQENIFTYGSLSGEYKRKYRELDDEVKRRISDSSKGKKKTAEHRLHISQSMEKYWRRVPRRPKDEKPSVEKGEIV